MDILFKQVYINFRNQKNFLIKKTDAARYSDPLSMYRMLQRQKSFQYRAKYIWGRSATYINLFLLFQCEFRWG
jgi:hypothetical protein